MKLPLEVERAYHEWSDGRDPEVRVRALNCLEGELGETYTLGDHRGLFLHSRRIGGDTKLVSFDWDEISGIQLTENPPFAYLILTHADQTLSLKFSMLDKDSLTRLRQLQPATGTAPAQGETGDAISASTFEDDLQADNDGIVADERGKLTPLAGFCAAVYAMIQVDGKVDAAEMDMLKRQIGDEQTIANGLGCLRRLGTIALLDELKRTFDHPQKLCLMANLIEISMADGLLRSAERRLLQQIRDALDLAHEDYAAIFEILMLKNNLSVFQPD